VSDPVDECAQVLMRQVALFPAELADLVERTRFRPGYEVLLGDLDRGQGCSGLTLMVLTSEMDTYDPDCMRPVWHYFPVPAAAYNRQSWQRWLFERLHEVSKHEDMEWFRIVADDGTERRPLAPNHGPGWDPYLITELATDTDRRTSFRGEVSLE
jgi:hypothetical protein